MFDVIVFKQTQHLRTRAGLLKDSGLRARVDKIVARHDAGQLPTHAARRSLASLLRQTDKLMKAAA